MPACIIGACALASGLVYVSRTHLVPNEHITHNDVSGPMFSIIGTVLAVMMSFMVVGVWQEYDAASTTVQREASALSDLYHIASAFPQPVRGRVHRAVERYIGVVIHDEWPLMRQGAESRKADRSAYRLGFTVQSWRWKTQDEQSLKAIALQYVSQFWNARRDRMNDNRRGIPIVLWSTMLLIGAISVAFSCFFRVDRPGAHYVMIVAVTAVITIIFTLIAELDYPFRGDVAIQPDALVHVIQQIRGTLPNAY